MEGFGSIPKTGKYFQYLGIDTIELGSHLIRVFRKKYPLNMELNPRDVVDDEVDFHAHVILQFGVKDGTWQKVGNVEEIKQVDVVFKTNSFVDTSSIWHIPYPERGKEDKKIDALAEERKKNNANWSIWRPNDKQLTFVGKLTDEYKNAEFGGVLPPDAILKKMRTGKYQGWGIND